jgi:hypothetical protein
MLESSRSQQAIESVVDPDAQIAWDLFCAVLGAYELAIALQDGVRAQQLWVPLQATSADLLRYYASMLQNLNTTNGG